MNSCLIRPLIIGVFALPLLVTAQQGSEGRQEPAGSGISGFPGQRGTGDVTLYSDPGNNFFSNVPINELSAKAYRRFHRRFREVPTGEYWFKYAQGYQISFMLDQHRSLAYYDQGGTFLYSLRYYAGTEFARDMTEFVQRRFPDYKIDVVTEVNNGQKIFYILQIMNVDNIKQVTVADGRIDVVRELTNGGGHIGRAEAAR